MYSLNDNVNDSFDFEVGGHKYKMRYPTLDELQKIEKIALDKGSKSEDVLAEVYKYIDPQGTAPSIAETMRSQNVRVIANFNAMIMVEFGLNG